MFFPHILNNSEDIYLILVITKGKEHEVRARSMQGGYINKGVRTMIVSRKVSLRI